MRKCKYKYASLNRCSARMRTLTARHGINSYTDCANEKKIYLFRRATYI